MQNQSLEIVRNQYGKARVRLLKVTHGEHTNDIHEWTVEVLLQGDFDSSYSDGDNSRILTTDTMKNTVYSLARESRARQMEEFALELIEHLLARNPQIASARITVEAALWKRLTVAGKPHSSTFMRGSAEVQLAIVEGGREQPPKYTAGFKNLQLLQTANSAFSGYIQDSLTTLPETRDRVFGTAVEASWTFNTAEPDFARSRHQAREVMLEVFANHHSESVQHTLYAMAEAALAALPELDEITLAMPNKHCLLIDLSRFGQTNPNEIFVPTDEPHGYIEATVRRRR